MPAGYQLTITSRYYVNFMKTTGAYRVKMWCAASRSQLFKLCATLQHKTYFNFKSLSFHQVPSSHGSSYRRLANTNFFLYSQTSQA